MKLDKIRFIVKRGCVQDGLTAVWINTFSFARSRRSSRGLRCSIARLSAGRTIDECKCDTKNNALEVLEPIRWQKEQRHGIRERRETCRSYSIVETENPVFETTASHKATQSVQFSKAQASPLASIWAVLRVWRRGHGQAPYCPASTRRHKLQEELGFIMRRLSCADSSLAAIQSWTT